MGLKTSAFTNPDLSREELSWAAGFFDGEGTVSTTKRTHAKNRYIYTSVAQAEPTTLVRLQKAVGGLGHLSGPKSRQRPHWQPLWKWQANSFEHCQAVVAMLWHWLSGPKRKQAVEALSKAKLTTPGWVRCQTNGHDVLPNSAGNMYCRTCSNQHSKELYYRRKAAGILRGRKQGK